MPFRLPPTLLCALALLGVSSAAFANPTPAPVADKLIGQEFLKNSGDATELAALRRWTGVDNLVLSSKLDARGQHAAIAASGLDAGWMLADPAQPGYFALKFGHGGTDGSVNTFFFENVGDLSQLVWTNDQVKFFSGGDCDSKAKDSNAKNGKAKDDKAQDSKAENCGIGRLSHYITAPAVAAPVADSGGKDADEGTAPPESGGLQGGGQQQHEVPEPGSLALPGLGALAVYGARRQN